MAIGFTPKHIEEFALENLSAKDFLVIAHEAIIKHQWEISYISNFGLIAYTSNGIFSNNYEIKIKIENNLARVMSACTGSEFADWGRNKRNVTNLLGTIEELKQSLTAEELDRKYSELKEQIVSDEDDILKLPPPTTSEQLNDFFSIFKPSEGFFITPILIDLNILVFLLMAINGANLLLPDNEILLRWGANFRPATLNGELWRLFTCCFVHIGIIHLLLNLYALLYIGVLLEPLLGKLRFASAYILSGIAASVTSLWWHSFTISAGASGAIFGMYGVFLALLTTDLIEKTARKALLTSIVVFVGYNLVYGLQGGIDNAAHIGGLLSGMLIGYFLVPSLKKPEAAKLNYGILGLLSVLIFTSSALVLNNLTNDIGIYDKRMQEFVTLESKALEIYKLPENTPTQKILEGVRENGIKCWQQNIKILSEVSELDLPLQLRTRNRILKEYCELRIKSYELIYKAISENTDQYQQQIEEYTKEIEKKINELKGE